jgi:hypothetical protein
MSEELSYTGETAGDENLNVTFYKVVNEEGNELVYVRIAIPGNDCSIIEEPVNDHYKARFRKQWEVFNNVRKMTGTPIEQWEGCPDAMIRELKKLEFNYIEQLASAPDNLLQGIMGGATWRKKAQDYLERNKVTPEMVMNAQQAQIEELKQQVAALTSRRKSTE